MGLLLLTLGVSEAAAKAIAEVAPTVSYRFGKLAPRVLGQTNAITGAVTIREGLTGEQLALTVAHEGTHSIAVKATPLWLRRARYMPKRRGGLQMLADEAMAEWVATQDVLRSLAYPLNAGEVKLTALLCDLLILDQARSLKGHAVRWLDERIPPSLSEPDWVEGQLPLGSPGHWPLSTAAKAFPFGVGAAGPASSAASEPAIRLPTPMSPVRDLFASRLTDTNRVMFGTQFGIDGVAVELTEGSPVAKVEFESVLLTDGPEMRGGHMALTRADAQIIEHRVNQVLAEWSVHRRFGARITASGAVGDEAQLTIDGVRVLLRHARAEATVAGQPVQITPPPRRALNNMTLSPSAWATLDLAIAAAKRAAQPEPAPQAALPPLWSAETAAPNSVFRQEPKTLFGSRFGLKPYGSGF